MTTEENEGKSVKTEIGATMTRSIDLKMKIASIDLKTMRNDVDIEMGEMMEERKNIEDIERMGKMERKEGIEIEKMETVRENIERMVRRVRENIVDIEMRMERGDINGIVKMMTTENQDIGRKQTLNITIM